MSLVGWIGGMPGREALPSVVTTEDNLDCLLDLGIGKKEPKEFLEPLRSEMLKLCMYFVLSLIEGLSVGTSILSPCSLGIGIEAKLLLRRPLWLERTL